jgi:hypothetical protein
MSVAMNEWSNVKVPKATRLLAVSVSRGEPIKRGSYPFACPCHEFPGGPFCDSNLLSRRFADPRLVDSVVPSDRPRGVQA